MMGMGILWIGLIAVVVWLVRSVLDSSGGGSSVAGSRRSPVDILEERYAKGEITTAELEEGRRALAP